MSPSNTRTTSEKTSLLLRKLEKYISDHSVVPNDSQIDDLVFHEMLNIEDQVYQNEIEREKSLDKIPRFFFKKPENSELLTLVNAEAHRMFVEHKSGMILSSHELDDLWEQLLNFATPPIINNDERIGYSGFQQVAKYLSETHAEEYCSPSLFLKFFKDDLGRISIPNYFNYVLRKTSLIQNKINLSQYDKDADNYLSEKDLEAFVIDSIPKFPCLKDMTRQFRPHYVTTVVRKFCFFLDSHKRDRISIDELVASPILIEFNELMNEDIPEQDLLENWFSLQNAQGLFAMFRQLNLTMSGSLSRNEIRGFNNSSLTITFIDRLLQEYGTKKGQLDFKMFVNFLLAYDNKNTPQSIHFFWPILDLNRTGYLAPFTINYFFRDIQKRLQKNNADVVSIKDILEEIYAMVMPSDPAHITLQDLLDCKCGGTVISMLTDVEAFWAYDNRESLAQQNQ